jgi:hypothetical protein
MEAALRTVYELVTGREVPFENLNIEPCRGFEGSKQKLLLNLKTVLMIINSLKVLKLNFWLRMVLQMQKSYGNVKTR